MSIPIFEIILASRGRFLLKWTALIVYWRFIYTESHSWLVHRRLLTTDSYLYLQLSTTPSTCLLFPILFSLTCPTSLSQYRSNVSTYLSPLQHILRSDAPSIRHLLCVSMQSHSWMIPCSSAAHLHPPFFDKVTGSPPSHYYRTSLHTHDNRIGKEEGTLFYSWPCEHCLDMSHNDVFLHPLSICMNIVRWFVWATAIVDH